MLRKMLLCTLCFLLFFTCASAEDSAIPVSDADLLHQEQLYSQLEPLLTLTVAASLQSPEEAFTFAEGDKMAEDFAASLAGYATRFPMLSIPTEDIQPWLSDNFALSVPDTILPESPTTDMYTGLMLIECSPSPDGTQLAVTAEIYQAPRPYHELTDEDWYSFSWLDSMAAITLTKSEHAALGWSITSLAYIPSYFASDTDLLVEEDNEAFSILYLEPIGCSLAVPVEFTQEALQTADETMSESLTDDSAFLTVQTSHLSADTALQTFIAGQTDVTLLSYENPDVRCARFAQDTKEGLWFCVADRHQTITVTLLWDPLKHEYLGFLDRMLNSILMDADSQG